MVRRLLPLLFVPLWLVACAEEPPPAWTPVGSFSCTPGSAVTCPCLNGADGLAICGGEGNAIGACDCPELFDPDAVDTTVSNPFPDAWPPDSPSDAGGVSDALVADDTEPEPDVFDDDIDDSTPPPPAGEGKCVDQVGGEALADMEQVAWSLGSSCSEAEPFDILGCIQNGVAEVFQVSPGCAGCFAQYVLCVQTDCAGPCSDYGSAQCLACREPVCVPAWGACMFGSD